MTIKTLFNQAVEKKASDLHLVAGIPPILRIDGVLTEVEKTKPLNSEEIKQMIFSVLDEEQKKIFLTRKDFDFSFTLNDGTRYRINIHFEKGNMGLVARVINDNIPTLKETGMPEIVTNLLNIKQGLILVTGPTGCGKSTSLAAMINYINNSRSSSIITLEDPIEYLFKPEKSIIIQRQLGSDMKSFAKGLKHVLRQDPDIVMVGEMRDLETISTTITLAETGHLVLATLHTYSASQTIDRIIDIFPPYQQNQIRMQLSMTLAGVISQRLLPKIKGGRIAAREILINTPAVSNLIRENKIAQIKSVIETSLKDGMMSLDKSIQKYYTDDIISKEIAQSQMTNPETLEKFKIF
jgi:twitching motility protein PilT